jgi:membrane protease YdiL (CAAX protease family)
MIGTIFFLFILVLIPLFYLRVIKEFDWKKIKEELIPKIQNPKKEFFGIIKLFLALVIFAIIISMSLGIIESISGQEINDLHKVGEVINEEIQEGWVLFGVFLIVSLFVEEFFFRSFLVKRLGMLGSTIIFTIFHIGYGSIAEIIGVFLLGLILAWWFKKHKSLIQNYFGHLLYDIIAIAIYLLI